jgi:hypothetical protein
MAFRNQCAIVQGGDEQAATTICLAHSAKLLCTSILTFLGYLTEQLRAKFASEETQAV